MSKEVILDNQFVTVWYHNDTKIVHQKFHKFIHGEEFRAGLNQGLEAFKKYGASKWLSDDRENPVLKKEDMEWSASTWRPAVIKAGLKYWAIVMPEMVEGQMIMKKIVTEYANTGVTVEVFTDSDNALKWLESQ
jgi:hypothetical protein